ncbi:MAG: RNA polymerase sigma factor [Bryobacteraceae bacterium]
MASVAALEPDAQLMLRVKEGDATGFALLLERHRTPLVHYLYRLVQNQGVAEELAQEVFLRVYRARARYEPTARFTTWLYRIATRLALNWLRDGRNERGGGSLDQETPGLPLRQFPDGRPTAEQELLEQARRRQIRAAVMALPPKQRAAVLMHKYLEMAYAQIARVLGCSESAVKSLLFRAYEKLRAKLAHMV